MTATLTPPTQSYNSVPLRQGACATKGQENARLAGNLQGMWSLRFLGDLGAERDGIATTLPPRKYTALLAYLVLHPARRFGRDELTALFWPDSDAEAGRAALRTALSALRKDFGADLLDAGAETVRVREGVVTTDAAQFGTLLAQAKQARNLPARESAILDAALALYGGPLLPGIYADWVVAERERLETLWSQAQIRREVVRRAEPVAPPIGPHSVKEDGPQLKRLPLYTGPWVGRETETDTLARALTADPPPRLLTLTGPGGMGKTRLAVETAGVVAAHFAGAVCFVPLAALTDGAEIGGAIADALQIAPDGGDALAHVCYRLNDLGPSLLVLDNGEQLVEAGAGGVVRRLLAAAPGVTVLLTSRRLLGVEGEREFVLPPLAPPACAELFRQHALTARPDFEGGETLPTLCERLDGIPLAVELCASWARVLTGHQMLEHLDRRFGLLTTRRQDMPARHRSLHAALEWGCPTDPNLLGFFAALSVFRGGWTLAAATAVGGANALSHLATLREQSLVLAEPVEGDRAMRYRMLETIREFAGEKLTDTAREEAGRRSLQFFLDLAVRETPRLAHPDSAPVFAALDRETANFRAAIEFGLTDTPESLSQTLTLIHNMRWCWGIRGHFVPLETWVTQIYRRRDDLVPSERAYITLMYMAYQPLPRREALAREALACYAQAGEAIGCAQAHEALAHILRDNERYEEMALSFQAAANGRDAAGDRRGKGYVLAVYAGTLYSMNRVAEARTLWQECRVISREFDDTGSLAVLDRAEGVALLGDGKPDEAIPFFEAALSTFRHKGEDWHRMDTLGHLGQAHAALAQQDAARAFWTEGLTLARSRQDGGRVDFFLARLAELPIL